MDQTELVQLYDSMFSYIYVTIMYVVHHFRHKLLVYCIPCSSVTLKFVDIQNQFRHNDCGSLVSHMQFLCPLTNNQGISCLTKLC